MQFGDVPEVLLTKQPLWDRPGVLVNKALVEATLSPPHMLAVSIAEISCSPCQLPRAD